ncbi:phosphate ABC transporter permease PstA [bacterium]|nr:phosphate ABC transporter permease PstA [bacterium]
MSQVVDPSATVEAESAKLPRVRRRVRPGASVIAQGEPMLWLTGGGLVICFLMIVTLLLYVLWQGVTTFWPQPIVQVETIDGRVLLGEAFAYDAYELKFSNLAGQSEAAREKLQKMLHPAFHAVVQRELDAGTLSDRVNSNRPMILKAVITQVRLAPTVQQAAPETRAAIVSQIEATLDSKWDAFVTRFAGEVSANAGNESGDALVAAWNAAAAESEATLGELDVDAFRKQFTDGGAAVYSVWASEAWSSLTLPVAVPMRRREFRTENFELTSEHFNWVSDFEIRPDGESFPEWAMLLERVEGGRFYGFPMELRIDGEAVETESAAIWAAFPRLHSECRERWLEGKEIDEIEGGAFNRRREHERLALIETGYHYGKESEEYRTAQAALDESERANAAEYAEIRSRIDELAQLNSRYSLLMRTIGDQQQEIPLAEIVRACPANRLQTGEKCGIYLSRWREFLFDNPREANSEGGVYPAIFGTVVMTLLMSIAVVPFGVLAALYLREYARAGFVVSAVRIAINNLAGVPSIVFGVFGVGFFCYMVGASIDELFYPAKTANVGPTFGTGGLFWASLTLALLTLPVVIVATEEALSAVPRSMREGSLACGATKWQTIRRIVLPRALPGIMTGTILAMARGAGEVAPLMLVGAVKLAPHLVFDLHDWSGSFGPLPTGALHPERSFMHLGFHIFDLGFHSQNSEAAKPMVYTTTLLLIGIIAVMNVAAIWLRAQLRKKFQFSQF